MLLEYFNSFVSTAAEKPLFLLDDQQIYNFKQTALPALETVMDNLEDDTETKKQIQLLHDHIAQENIDEFNVAKILGEIAVILIENAPPEKLEDAISFRKNLEKFYKRSKMFQLYKEKRQHLLSNMRPEEVVSHDRKHCESVGMLYVLEYLLGVYKAIEDAPDSQQKMRYIISREIATPDGDVPGLWFDFMSDEILQKFILDILDDSWREQLIRSFYETKAVVTQIQVQCDPQGQCHANYQPENVSHAIQALRHFIRELIHVYQDMGIEKLSSFFMSSYGKNTQLKNLPF